jgi:hypothetical protein
LPADVPLSVALMSRIQPQFRNQTVSPQPVFVALSDSVLFTFGTSEPKSFSRGDDFDDSVPFSTVGQPATRFANALFNL